ncbi:MAG: ABC transporter ATP-binding protein [Acidobacteriaceae bacterium]|nr:ABC transporter ATP-binding protein [Acidobacteriaceae bacterium]MBV8569763.1 ABC transporter ATP-binding protein [Acidobacteriaceae bacterium]
MRRLLRYMRPYRKVVAASLLLLLVDSILQIIGPLLTKLAVDRYLEPVRHAQVLPFLDAWLSHNSFTGLTQIAVLYLAVVVLGFFFDFGQTYLMQWTGQQAMFDLRRELMTHLQTLDIAYFDKNPVGRLVTRITTDVDVLNDLFASGLVTILGDILMLSFVILAMLRLSPGMTGLMLAVMPVVVFVTMRFRRTASQSYRRIRVAIAKINAYLQEHIAGIAVLQLFNREERSRQEFAKINRDHMVAFKDSITAYGWFYPTVEFLGMLALALLLGYGGIRIRQGALTLGVLVAFFQYGLRFFRPIQDLSEKYNILQGAMAASERVFKLLDTQPVIVSPESPASFPEGPVDIEFDHVWFAYNDEDWVLRDVSFRVAPRETVAIVGHTGAGKTTLTNLLLRFYDVQRGAIRIGGIDVRRFNLVDLRSRFGVVLQDAYLFTGNIDSNIRLGTGHITAEDVRSAAERVNLLDFIDELPDRFDTPVRERGSGFSTGQKQLISFARALAHDPRILILDEATSSVDTETELRVREALTRLVSNRTSVVIAHRLSTIQRAERIIVMHKAQLREMGTHQELLALRGIYWKLYQLQYKEQELERREELAPQQL